MKLLVAVAALWHAWLCLSLPQHTEEPLAPQQQYSFRYIAGRYPGHVDHTHSETGDGSGHVRSSFAYVDPRFQVRKVDYMADDQGFHPVMSNPVVDTPTVAAAKQRHADLFNQISEQHQRIAAERLALAAASGNHTDNNY